MRGLVIAAWVAALAACASSSPDTVLLGGRVFTADPERPWAEALAIRSDRIVAVGDTTGVAAMASEGTVRRELAGRLVIPGFNDAHVDIADSGVGAIRAMAQAAVASGLTSMQLFSMSRPVTETVRDLVDANTSLRFRVLRAPRPGPQGETLDSRPHLPPQPTLRIDVRGMGFVFGREDGDRIRQAVGWAYGSEDPLAIQPADSDALLTYIETLEQTGLAEIWQRKRPRLEKPASLDDHVTAQLAAVGAVVVQRPGEDDRAPLATVLRAGGTLALGSGRGTSPFAVLDWATSPDRGSEALTMAQAVTAFTRGSAYAEFADRDRGHLSVGAFADLAVLSDDAFALPPGRVAGIRSVLTMIGGRPAYDVP